MEPSDEYYDDQEQKAAGGLTNAVELALNNGVDPDEIIEIVESAIEGWSNNPFERRGDNE